MLIAGRSAWLDLLRSRQPVHDHRHGKHHGFAQALLLLRHNSCTPPRFRSEHHQQLAECKHHLQMFAGCKCPWSQLVLGARPFAHGLLHIAGDCCSVALAQSHGGMEYHAHDHDFGCECWRGIWAPPCHSSSGSPAYSRSAVAVYENDVVVEIGCGPHGHLCPLCRHLCFFLFYHLHLQ